MSRKKNREQKMSNIVEQIIHFFGGSEWGATARTAKCLGCSPQFVGKMKKRGYVSGPIADVIERKSNGEFKAIELREHARRCKGRKVH